ncbi:LysM peptidoglycan-binding domain-containing protein [Adhaeribacter radiodurans]|uniref:LysM peptidoglycan-binding domain-containing protein n=1 Tax=Adhaeribacter radiodurans TaxID=2745197 RepID=A0A7L7LAG9_9BACT|nr:LysM domain-containing protein [Adhaeribacter radiodurans]QMU29831.1 LysM peptidoglycan-binding domain-containing protein [Adhaeribacter radiodurans]
MIKRLVGWIGLVFWLLLSNSFSGWAQTTLPPDTNVFSKKEKLESIKNVHQVQPGDTYYSLSKKYQIPVDSLIKWNGSDLPIGKLIRIAAESLAINTTDLDTLIQVAPPSEKVIPEQRPSHSPEISGQAVEKSTTTQSAYEEPEEGAGSDKMMQRVLVIPFDPYLYFSDADEDIARQSDLPKQNIRYIFRSRLNAFLDPNGFEIINLLDGNHSPTSEELKNAYKSLAYSYQDVTTSRFHLVPRKQKSFFSGPESWFRKQKEKAGLASPSPEEASVAAEGEKYYGVKVKSPDFYRHFNQRYNLDYYIFINQFEIHTDYTNCIDRTTQNFIREFLVHYTIFDSQGELIAGNKVKIPYVSNVNEINKIVRDNLSKIAQRILADLPNPQVPSSEAAQN